MKLAPLRNNERARTTTAYEHDDEATPSPVAATSARGEPLPSVRTTDSRRTLDPFMAEVCHGVGRSWRVKFAGAVRSSTVVVADIFREYCTQVPLTKDIPSWGFPGPCA
jgi:hypothetical protein